MLEIATKKGSTSLKNHISFRRENTVPVVINVMSSIFMIYIESIVDGLIGTCYYSGLESRRMSNRWSKTSVSKPRIYVNRHRQFEFERVVCRHPIVGSY